MKKLIIAVLLLLSGNFCYASDMNSIFYGIRSGIDVLSDVNRLRGQVNQTNAQQQQLQSQPQTREIRQKPQSANTTSFYDKNNIYTKNEKVNKGEVEKILIPVFNNETGLYGCQTTQGKIIISPQFEDAKPFSEGLAAVYNGQRWGYVNSKGST